MKKEKKENIYNIPNPLSLIRILISPFLIYFAVSGKPLWVIALIFIFAAFTDFLDGFLARKYNQETIFGRKLDIIADRIFMASSVITLLYYLDINNLLTLENTILILFLMTREILSAPVFIGAIITKSRAITHVRFTGKITTTFQSIAFPMVILKWEIAIYFVIATALAGLISAGYYAYDALINPDNNYQKKMDRYYKNLKK